VDTLNTVNVVVTYAFIYAGTVGQFAFVVLYFFRPWRKYRPTRALMSKSFSLFLILSQSFIVLNLYGLRHLDWPAWLIVYRVGGDAFMLWAIYYQLYALVKEIIAGYTSEPLKD
jgi:hypothetical protein